VRGSRARVPLVVFLVFFGLSPQGRAHRPATGEGEIEVEAPKISYAFYGTFESGDEVVTLHLDYDEPFTAPFEILVPKRPGLEDHRPMYALVGPGLPAPTSLELERLPRAVPDGAGVVLVLNDHEEREVIFESFTQRSFWTSGPLAIPMGVGETEVWVFSPDGTTGDFALGFGVEEDFSDVGCGDLVGDWVTYAY
jgi:hypothetical protein